MRGQEVATVQLLKSRIKTWYLQFDYFDVWLLQPVGIQEDDLVTVSKSEDLSVLGHLLLADDLVCGDEALDLAAGDGVPDTDSLVVAEAHQLLVAGGVHHLLDAAHATLELDDRLTRLLQVKYPDDQS